MQLLKFEYYHNLKKIKSYKTIIDKFFIKVINNKFNNRKGIYKYY